MSLPTKDGTFKAQILEWGVKTDGTPAFVAKFDLLEHWNGTDWDPAGGDYQITGYFYPVKKDGSINEGGYNSLRESLGWDGGSWASLEGGDYSKTEVQVVLGFEEYKGQQKIKVQYMNPIDRTPGGPGVGKADPQAIRSLDAQFGSKFRAQSGTAPAATRTAAPAPVASSNGGAAKSAKLLAYEAFNAKFDADADKETRDRMWKEILPELATKDLLAPTDAKLWTDTHWKKAAEVIADRFDPKIGLCPF